jgi:hypothetical protein
MQKEVMAIFGNVVLEMFVEVNDVSLDVQAIMRPNDELIVDEEVMQLKTFDGFDAEIDVEVEKMETCVDAEVIGREAKISV